MNDRDCGGGGSRRDLKPALAVLAFAMACGAAGAQDDASLRSPDCLRALDALQRQEAALAGAASRPDAGDRASTPQDSPGSAREQPRAALPAPLLAARHRAAVAGLGARADRPLPPRRPVLTAPISAPPIGRMQAPTFPTLADPARTSPVRIAPPPVTVTTCDAVSCWTSDGMRWQRSGAGLMGPGGMCSGAPGGVLQCP